ncbi:hypothetical protein [Zoogloea sp.]|uniref:hypothetical protein n=1 Tax=Zoogloea sp. TaxID=49181 RepID=UPI001ACAA9D1|nr:hypothetical protein [Zoogloea sp.]MBN8281947.1 hypothetical protein [Zoogloea sp.]
MSACVLLNPDGTLTPLVDPVGQCTGFVLLEAGEWQLAEFMVGLTSIPPASDLLQVFSYGVTIPMVFGFIGWGVGLVFRFFRHDDE